MNGRTDGWTAHAVGRAGDGGGEVREDAEKKKNRNRIVRARAIGYDGAGGEWKHANGRCDGGGPERQEEEKSARGRRKATERGDGDARVGDRCGDGGYASSDDYDEKRYGG